MKLFKAKFLSYEQHTSKPDSKIFQNAKSKSIELLNNPKEYNILYIDDKEDYVNIAANDGMKGFVYRSYSHFIVWLRNQGIYIP